MPEAVDVRNMTAATSLMLLPTRLELNNLVARSVRIHFAVTQARGTVPREHSGQGYLFIVVQTRVCQQTTGRRRSDTVRVGQLGPRLVNRYSIPKLLLVHRAITALSLTSHGASRATSSQVKYLIGAALGGNVCRQYEDGMAARNRVGKSCSCHAARGPPKGSLASPWHSSRSCST